MRINIENTIAIKMKGRMECGRRGGVGVMMGKTGWIWCCRRKSSEVDSEGEYEEIGGTRVVGKVGQEKEYLFEPELVCLELYVSWK